MKINVSCVKSVPVCATIAVVRGAIGDYVSLVIMSATTLWHATQLTQLPGELQAHFSRNFLYSSGMLMMQLMNIFSAIQIRFMVI